MANNKLFDGKLLLCLLLIILLGLFQELSAFLEDWDENISELSYPNVNRKVIACYNPLEWDADLNEWNNDKKKKASGFWKKTHRKKRMPFARPGRMLTCWLWTR
jgi:hypothetical protein